MSDAIRAAAVELRRELDEKVKTVISEGPMVEILKIQQALNQLEDLLGDPRTTLTQILGMEDQGSVSIRPDEFYGLSPLDAAKRYLKSRGSARPFGEIVQSIRAGGCRVTDETELKISLGRSTFDIAKVGNDLYGLLEFYPHIKRGKKRKPGVAGEPEQEGQNREAAKDEVVSEEG